jgi:hypothetical protein
LQNLDILLFGSYDQFTDTGKAEIQLFEQLIEQLVAADNQPALQCLRRAVMAGVNDAAVGFSGAEAHLFTHFKNHRAKTIARQFTGNGTADDPAANDGNIVHICSVSFLINVSTLFSRKFLLLQSNCSHF